MTHYQAGEARIRRQRTQEAISLAMQGRWDEAIDANRSIIEIFPNDLNAYNRLGKALTEMGQYAAARDAYSQALKIDSKNSIAMRNLQRLTLLKGTRQSSGEGHARVIPQIFIEETGKTGVAILEQLAPWEVLAKLAPGDSVELVVKGKGLLANNQQGEYIGQIEPKIGMRLAKLIEGGNRYSGTIASAADGEVKVIISEVFQHPTQSGRLSFPAKGDDGFRAYVKGSILKYELGEEGGVIDDSGEVVEMEEEEEVLPDGMTLLTAGAEGEETAEGEPE